MLNHNKLAWFLVSAFIVVGAAACAESTAKNGGPSVQLKQPAADAPTLNASDIKGPDLGHGAAKSPTVTANPDIKAPQVNGPSVNLDMNTQNKADGGTK